MTVYRESLGRPARYVRADDRVVTAQIRTVIRTRASYGARRVRALVNREFATGYNLKRIQRLMDLNGWTLPRATRRRTGRAHRRMSRCWRRGSSGAVRGYAAATARAADRCRASSTESPNSCDR